MGKSKIIRHLLILAVSSSTAGAVEIAVTLDDPYTGDAAHQTGRARDAAIRKHLRDRRAKAALFVSGKNVDNGAGRALLRAWDREGHFIANHSYSHPNLNRSKVSAEFFKRDIIRAESLLAGLTNFQKFFRFPYLKEGDSAAERDTLRRFLRRRGYRAGAVTIDASDWYISDRLRARLEHHPGYDVSGFRDYYLQHIWARSTYYNELSKSVLGREVKHTLLLHHNPLNALFLGDLLDMFQAKGWKIISPSEAYTDPVFQLQPATVPAGEGLVWALAKETGRFDDRLRYPAEDGPYEKPEMDRLGL